AIHYASSFRNTISYVRTAVAFRSRNTICSWARRIAFQFTTPSIRTHTFQSPPTRVLIAILLSLDTACPPANKASSNSSSLLQRARLRAHFFWAGQGGESSHYPP